MQPPLPALEADLVIEHGGHAVKVTGSASRFVANFPSLLAMLHFARVWWPLRDQVPRQIALDAQWRQLRIRVRRPLD
jgi:hypothetical protein